MNEIERRLTEAMTARAREVEPHDELEALDRITKRVDMKKNRNRNLAVAGIAAAVLVAVGAVALLRDDNGNGQRVNVGPTSTSTSTSTSTTTAPTVIPSSPEAIWPFAASGKTFDTPEAAAKSFAVDYLGMTNARIGSTIGNDVEVFPNTRGTARTLVHAEHRSTGWVVVGASADQIVVDEPRPFDTVTSPLMITGSGTAFEATIGIQLRPLGTTKPVFESNTMAGANGEIGPFSTSVEPPATSEPLVLLLFEGDASGAQSFTKVTALVLVAGK